MAWFKKKADPFSDRARALSAEIAALEDKIKKLDSQLQQSPAPPRFAARGLPHSAPTYRAPDRRPGRRHTSRFLSRWTRTG